jgi:hypothetical protein
LGEKSKKLKIMNELVLVKVSLWNGENKADKNGVSNVYLRPIAGKMPNRAMVLSGTIAESEGLTPGIMALVQVTEREPNPEYGRQFGVSMLDGQISGKDIFLFTKELGKAVVVDVNAFDDADGKPAAPAVPSLNTIGLNTKPTVKTAEA